MKKLFVQLDRCIGCQAHSLACQRVRLGTMTLQSAYVDEVGSLPVVCRHCEEPACVAACPQDAMTRDDDGIVRRNSSRCTGCKSCVYACPFGVLSIDTGLIKFALGKCDLCASRTAEGLEPACVATCPTGALRWEETGDMFEKEGEIVLGAQTTGYRTYIRRP